MQQADSIINAIKDFISTCPLLDDGYKVNVDYLSEGMSYSVDPIASQSTISKYTDGSRKKQYQFALTSKESYDEDARVNIENSGFYEDFESWIEDKSDSRDFPTMPDSKQEPYGIEILNSGFLYNVDGADAVYRIECRLLYTQDFN